MNSSRKTRRAVLPLTVGLLALGVAVFGWGLHYELSLYHSEHTIGHHWQPATLSTERERPSALHVAVHHDLKSFAAASLSLLSLPLLAFDLLILGKLSTCHARLQSRQRWRLRVSAGFSPFLRRRPPPILSL